MKQIAIVHGALASSVERKAVAVLGELLFEYTSEYPCCYYAGSEPKHDSRFTCIYLGTKKSNPAVQRISRAVLTHDEEYFVQVKEGTVLIEGYDEAGVLYGCIDFYNKYLLKYEYPPDVERYRVNCLESPLPDAAFSSYPSVRERGIWTWGHVIYDFRGFIDHMVLLKMNTLIVWNDQPPVNAREFVAYAHSCGIRVIWGFSWLWGTDCNAVKLDELETHCDEIFSRYEREYGDLEGDGIYFQTATETSRQEQNGILIADAVVRFVNRTAALFYEKYPNMLVQFGLHATSVRDHLEYIAKVDPRIQIVWENCGSFPFSYLSAGTSSPAQVIETDCFVKKIAVLRGEKDRFGAVTKGMTKLDWTTFEHRPAPGYIGVSSRDTKNERIARKRKIWKRLQVEWLVHADKALASVRTMARIKQGNLCLTALIEDGMFEENIMYPAALYSEMLWNCEAGLEELICEVALRSYVTFA